MITRTLKGYHAKHMNNNLLCAVFMHTSGNDPMKHDILDLCFLPVDGFFKIAKGYMPFILKFKPRYPDSGKVTEDHIKNGTDYFTAETIFESWFSKLELADNKRLTLLGFDMYNIHKFLFDWLTPDCYNLYFTKQTRDIASSVAFLNDRAHIQCAPYPIQKTKWAFILSELEIPRSKGDVALECKALVEAYRRIVCLKEL